ncbi:MAG: ribosome-associated translation inhibitor RaiA [Acidimicrobiia bacterium]|nr:ribosome-associated translation inhibitor RaiA [Acidimicrobiia bacterium]MYG91946.1 ribosome-associated translation inhibitor RaiA [Acidimicrobiia bacterium]
MSSLRAKGGGFFQVDVRLSARNTEVTDDFRRAVTAKMGRAARVFSDLSSVDVKVVQENNPRLSGERFRIELSGQALGRTVRVEAAAPTAETALDTAADRFTRRIRRLKERVIDRNRQGGSPSRTDSETEGDEIVRVKRFIMKPMSVAEAQLQMEMLGHDFFFFLNSANRRHSVLYRRRDGRLGLIESGI